MPDIIFRDTQYTSALIWSMPTCCCLDVILNSFYIVDYVHHVRRKALDALRMCYHNELPIKAP